ncbi:MAG TPA: aldehyde dehydrogenase family protein, partial [Chloroflexota bacterium]|nr:aldehyde dehydrogenase family protein [Chloroflexota bacterium]
KAVSGLAQMLLWYGRRFHSFPGRSLALLHPFPGRSLRSLDPGGGPLLHPSPGRSLRSLDPSGGPGDEPPAPGDRLLPPTLVWGVSDEMALMQEEIFGPILPLVPYRTLEEAIAYVNDRPRPLALYYFDHAPERIERVLQQTISGGVTVNDVMQHLVQSGLPFGGVGPSGMGHYHGVHGFHTFSQQKAVLQQSRLGLPGLFRPPYGPRLKALIRVLLHT